MFAAQKLSTTEFATYGLALGAVAVAQTISTLSLGSAATRGIAAHREQNIAKAWRVLNTATILGLLTSALGGLAIAAWYGYTEKPNTIIISSLLACIVIGLVLRGIASGIAGGFEAWTYTAASNILAGGILVVCGALAPNHAKIVWFLSGLALSQIGALAVFLMMLLSFYRSQRPPRAESRPTEESRNDILKFSLPTFFLGMIPAVSYFYAQSKLNGSDHSGTTLASFVVVWQLANLAFLIPSVIARSFMPVVASLQMPNSRVATFALAIRLAAPGAMLGLIIAVPLALFPEYALSIYAKKYATPQSSTALVWMSTWAIVASAAIGIEFFAVSRAKIKFTLQARASGLFLLAILLSAGNCLETECVAKYFFYSSLLQLTLLFFGLWSGKLLSPSRK